MRKTGKTSIDYSNRKFGKLLAIKRISGGHDSIWLCKCDCGNKCKITASNLKRGAKFCWSCRNNNLSEKKWNGYGDIPHTFFSKIKRQAENRQLSFDITIEEIWSLFIKQNKKCALSDMDLFFVRKSKSKSKVYSTASLDRIDSNKGYTLDNVQWVHKDVNIMKNKYDQKYFVEICNRIQILHFGKSSRTAAKQPKTQLYT